MAQKFKLLRGRHVMKNPAYVERGENPPGTKRSFSFVPGDVIESEVDLAEKFNAPGMEPKFLKLESNPQPPVATNEGTPVTGAEDPPPTDPESTEIPEDLHRMTKAQLREICEAEEIEMPSSATKNDLLAAVAEIWRG